MAERDSFKFGIGDIPLGNIEKLSLNGSLPNWPTAEETRTDRLPSHVKMRSLFAAPKSFERYLNEKEQFERSLAKFPIKFQNALRDIILAIRFIDHKHLAPIFVRLFRSRGLEDILNFKIPHQYDQPGEKSAFRNAKAARSYLKKSAGSVGPNQIKKLHSLLMRGGVEGLSKEALGKFRGTGAYGEQLEYGVDPKIFRGSIYISFEALREETDALGKKVAFGNIHYPDIDNLSKAALARLATYDEALANEILGYQALSRSSKTALSSAFERRLNTRLIEGLVGERYRNLNQQLSQLDRSNPSKYIGDIIKTAALFERDMIQIHPFENGNGRTLRFGCLDALLEPHGIYRVRLPDPDKDILVTENAWVDQVARAIFGGGSLCSDLMRRFELGMRIENSPEFLSADLLRDVGIHRRNPRRKIETQNARYLKVDEAQFGAFLDARARTDSHLEVELLRDADKSIRQLRAEYKEFLKRTSCIYLDDKGRESVVRMQLIDLDYIMNFGKLSVLDLKAWTTFTRRWSYPQLVWRGVSDQNEPPTHDMMMSFFREPTANTVSQRLVETMTETLDREILISECIADMDRYNQLAVLGQIGPMARDHVFGRGMYEQSPFLSTTASRSFGEAMAMGALVIDSDMRSYRKRQSQLKSRILIGMLRGRGDLFANHLRLICDDFRARSSRQYEYLKPGGQHPDQVMLAQVIGPTGLVELNYVRNLSKPNEIVVTEGFIDPLKVPLSNVGQRHIIERDLVIPDGSVK